MPSPFSPRFLSLVVHDLRNSLNAINLSMQMIDHEVPPGCPDLEDDLRMVRENVNQIERMLRHLADYSRLLEEPIRLAPRPFDPRRLMADLVDEYASRSGTGDPPPATLEVRPGCPSVVELDPARAQAAIEYVLTNALVSADKQAPVRLILDGGPDRLLILARVDRPTHPSVVSTPLPSDSFERLMGSPNSRLGLELTIAARVSELFGGSARLDIDEGRASTLVLDWPARLPEPLTSPES